MPPSSSTLPPPSFIDDGSSFTARLPRTAKWIDSHSLPVAATIDTDATSVYTGSYIDDGADLLLPGSHLPGFGPIDPTFYAQRARQPNKGVWNKDIAHAVGGDIMASLARIRGVGVEVRIGSDGKDDGDFGKMGRTVKVCVPRKWGTFVIKEKETGRVVVVGRDGEFDSGPRVLKKSPTEKERGQGTDKYKRKERTGWIRAAPLSPAVPPPKETETLPPTYLQATERNRAKSTASTYEKDDHSLKKNKTPRPAKTLSRILESVHEDPGTKDDTTAIPSPTGFFMTGGASGWPSRMGTSVAPPSLVSSLTSKTKSRRAESRRSRTESHASVPGAWMQSRAQSLAPEDSVSSVEVVSSVKLDKGWGSEKAVGWDVASVTSHGSRKARLKGGDGSVKSYSTYRPPTVEDAPSVSSTDLKIGEEVGWSGSIKSVKSTKNPRDKRSEKNWNTGSQAANSQEWSGSAKASEKSRHGSTKAESARWSGSIKGVDVDSWVADSQATSKQHWGGSAKASSTCWTGDADDEPAGDDATPQHWHGSHTSKSDCAKNLSEVSSRSHRSRSSRALSRHSWDGYEFPKTASEVSVVGSNGSERTAFGERSWDGRSQQSHHSGKSGQSRGSHMGWEGIEASGGEQGGQESSDEWGGKKNGGERGFAGSGRSKSTSRQGSEAGASRHQSSYGEDNETWLTDNWCGTPIRVVERKTSVAGWE